MELLARNSYDIAEAAAERTQHFMSLVSSVILTLLAILFLYIYRSIATPLRELNEITKGFQNGDLSRRMNEARNNEFGKFAMHFNAAVSQLSDMISKVKEIAATLTINSDTLSESSLHISQSSKDASRFAIDGGQIVEQTIHGMNKISQSMKELTQEMEALGMRSEEIGEIVELINDIARQTNLLALNAAIEAARAGEMGRGFAVVAVEVKKLAERTAAATSDIRDMISGMQEDSTHAVKAMHERTIEVDEGVNLANQAGKSLSQIVESTQNVTDLIKQIATTSEGHTDLDMDPQASAVTQQLTALVHKLQQLVGGFKLRNEKLAGIRCESETGSQLLAADVSVHTPH
jgi:methyl-accepting chemotaxis protein